MSGDFLNFTTPGTGRPGVSGGIQNTTSCIEDLSDEFLYANLGIAFLILIVLSFTKKRVRLWLRLCWGLPSIVVPIDLIHSNPHRLAYVLVFGSISGDILRSFFNGSNVDVVIDTTWGITLSAIIVFFLNSLFYFPIFATVDTAIPILGYSIGFFYSIFLFGQTTVTTFLAGTECIPFFNISNESSTNIAVGILALSPIIVCQSLLLVWYVWQFFKEVVRLTRSKEPFHKAVFKQEQSTYHVTRVRWLLAKHQLKSGGRCTKFVNRVLNILYKYDPTIQYPLQFLAAVVVMLNIIFLLTIALTAVILQAMLPLLDTIARIEAPVERLAEGVDRGLEFFNATDVNSSSLILTFYDIVRDTATGLAVILPTGPLFAFVWNCVLLAHMISQVHKHLRLLGRGDFSFLPSIIPSPSYRLVAAVRYAGYQIGYFVWAWILVALVVWLAGVVGLIVYFLLKFYLVQTLQVTAAIGIPLIYSLLLYYAQLVVCKIFFVGDTNNKHTVITNQHAFHWFMYVMFFQNVVVGLTSSLLRILYSIGFGLLLLFRLDRVVLMRGFERFDGGHKTYIGFLYLEHTLNNPVLNVFASVLLEAVKKKKESIESPGAETVTHKDEVEEEEVGPNSQSALKLVGTTENEVGENGSNQLETQVMGRHASRQVTNRWLVAYTLLRNESIRELTASRLSKKRAIEAKKAEWKKRELEGKQKAVSGGDEELDVTSITIETAEQSKHSADSFPDQQSETGSTDHGENTTQL